MSEPLRFIDPYRIREFFVWDKLRGLVPADIIVGAQTKCIADANKMLRVS
jgi:hypothetical protein